MNKYRPLKLRPCRIWSRVVWYVLHVPTVLRNLLPSSSCWSLPKCWYYQRNYTASYNVLIATCSYVTIFLKQSGYYIYISLYEGKGKVKESYPVQAMKAYWDSRSTAPLMFNLGTTWRWAVSFTLQRLCPAERAFGARWIWSWVSPGAGIAVLENRSRGPRGGVEVQPYSFFNLGAR